MTPLQVLIISIVGVLLQLVQLSSGFSPLCLRQHHHPHPFRTCTKLALAQDEYDNIHRDVSSESSTSTQFAMDPHSQEAIDLVTKRLGLSLAQYEKLTRLAELIVSWNERINVVSRRDCTKEVIFGRHILPSLALLAITTKEDGHDEALLASSSLKNIVDIGTGGGFPGLPLAIALPNVNFVLVDSVGKKLIVVQEMIRELALDNVSIHHGRAEDMADDILISRNHRKAYDICVGRSVTSIPRFCFWMQDLLKEKDGKLLYIIGGELDEDVVQNAEVDVAIDDLLQQSGSSDKRILVFPQTLVKAIARASGEVKQFRGSRKSAAGPNPSKREKVKGAWSKRDKDGPPKQRGMENFKRYGY